MAVTHLILGGGSRTPETKLEMWKMYRGLGISKIYLLDFLSSIREELPEPVPGITFVKPRSFYDFIQYVKCRKERTDEIEFKGEGTFVFGGDSLAPRYYDLQLLRSVFDMFPVFGGSSAGASLAGNYIYGWDYDADNHLTFCRGLGYLPFIIDTHFLERNRVDRMQMVMAPVIGINNNSFHTYQITQGVPEISQFPDLVLRPDH